MPLVSGTRLGRYEVRSKLGEGGMGEVYVAWDAELERAVALKVLPAEVASDPQRMNRFATEARAASALNHPNILTVYDVGTGNGAPYVVSELLEGETLREQMGGAALPQRKAVDYALQIAQGLAAAHERGIVHRDLKPENLFVTKDARVKILDFGIAKLIEPTDGGEALTDLPTRKMNTDPGVAIGTVGYMSPEQVRGLRVDHRSDIFSFGAVLYELLSGKRAFKRDSAVETLNAILREDPPDLSETSPNISPALERLVRHCLEKNQDQRFRSAHDLAFALQAFSASGTISGRSFETASLPSLGSKLRERLVWVVATAAVLTSLAFAILYFRRTPPSEAPAVRFPISLPENVAFTWDVEQHNLSVSPDGRHLAFIATSEGQKRLWVRQLDSLAAQALPGTEGAYSPFWSPESRFIAFFAEGKLKKIDPTGGAAQTICELPDMDNIGTWGRDGTILVSAEYFREVHRVPVAGGQPSLLQKAEGIAYWFHFLPDGQHFLLYQYQAKPGSESNGIYIGSLDSTEPRLLLPLPPTRVEYAPPGYLFYVREGTLLAHPFDAKTQRLAGQPFVVVERLPYFGTGWAEFSVSENGVLAYMTDLRARRLAWFDRGGRETGQVGAPGVSLSNVQLSPDGQKVAMSIDDPRDSRGDLWIHDLTRDTQTRFTFGPANEEQFVWSPDGRRAAFFSDRGRDKSTLCIKELGDTGEGESPLEPGFHSPNDWSQDGRFIIYMQNPPTTQFDLWVLPLFGERTPFPFLQTPFTEGGAKFSPDGRWVAFMSNESGQYEVYVARFENPREKWRISTAGGRAPRWRRDGKELFYLAADNRLMSVSVKAGDTFDAGIPTALFRINATGSGYDVSANGQRFLVATNVAEAQSLPITLVLNWTSDLKR